MSKKPEQKLWDHIKENIGHRGHFDRIESTFTVNGRPDVNFCIEGYEGDLELKVYDPKQGGFVLRSAQNIWFKRRIMVGGNCWLFARCDYIPGNKPRFLLIKGCDVHRLAHDRTYDGWLAAAYKIWDGSVDWDDFVLVIRGHKS